MSRGRDESLCARRRRAPLLETLAAEYGTSLRRLERHGRFFAAAGARRPGLYLVVRVAPALAGGRAKGRCPLRFARLATLGLVLELFVVEEELLAGGKNEIGPAVNAFESLILEFH